MSQIITLLEDGWAGKLPSLGYLQTVAGLNDTGAAMLCGVASETYRRWRTDRTPPLYAFRLLSIMAGYVPWHGWEQWFFNPFDRSLNHPELKDGFSPSLVAEFLFLRQTYQTHATETGKRILPAGKIKPVYQEEMQRRRLPAENPSAWPTLRNGQDEDAHTNSRHANPVKQHCPLVDHRSELCCVNSYNLVCPSLRANELNEAQD